MYFCLSCPWQCHSQGRLGCLFLKQHENNWKTSIKCVYQQHPCHVWETMLHCRCFWLLQFGHCSPKGGGRPPQVTHVPQLRLKSFRNLYVSYRFWLAVWGMEGGGGNAGGPSALWCSSYSTLYQQLTPWFWYYVWLLFYTTWIHVTQRVGVLSHLSQASCSSSAMYDLYSPAVDLLQFLSSYQYFF